MDPAPALGAWSALVGVYQAVLHDVVARLEGEAGIDSGVYSALAYLEQHEPAGTAPLGWLQQQMHPRYSQPGLSRLVQRMEADGLVERIPDPDDGRASLVKVTRSGRARFRRASRVYSTAVEEHFGRFLTPTEATTLSTVLTRFASRRTGRA